MSILTLCGVSLICVCAVVTVRENGYKIYSVITACFCCALMLAYVFNYSSEGLGDIKAFLIGNTHIKHADVVLKAFGIAFVCELCADHIRELGSENLAKGLETAGKAEIMILCIQPIKEIMTASLSLVGRAW